MAADELTRALASLVTDGRIEKRETLPTRKGGRPGEEFRKILLRTNEETEETPLPDVDADSDSTTPVVKACAECGQILKWGDRCDCINAPAAVPEKEKVAAGPYTTWRIDPATPIRPLRFCARGCGGVYDDHGACRDCGWKGD